MVRKLFPFVDPIVIKYLCLDSNRSKQKCFLLKKKKGTGGQFQNSHGTDVQHGISSILQ